MLPSLFPLSLHTEIPVNIASLECHAAFGSRPVKIKQGGSDRIAILINLFDVLKIIILFYFFIYGYFRISVSTSCRLCWTESVTY